MRGCSSARSLRVLPGQRLVARVRWRETDAVLKLFCAQRHARANTADCASVPQRDEVAGYSGR